MGGWRSTTAGVLLVVVWATPAAAQDAARITGLVWGGDVTGVVSPRDGVGFFNYTSYEQDLLRLVRVRLLGELRLPARVDVVAEARAENEVLDVPTAFVRWQPRASVPVFVQAGRVPPVIGAFARRAYGTDNLLIGSPLAYQYLTSLRADAQPVDADDVLRMRARGWLSSFPVGNHEPAAGLPLIGLRSSDTGVAVSWHPGRWSAAAAMTIGVPADPRLRDNNGGLGWMARLATMRTSGVTAGVSVATGPWLDRAVPGATDDARQTLLGVDVEVARGRWIARGEWWHASFAVPALGRSLVALSGFVEGRYRWHPRWQTALRLDRITFESLPAPGRVLPWDASVWRIEAALGYRVARRLEVRVGWQHNWREAGRRRVLGVPTALASFWF